MSFPTGSLLGLLAMSLMVFTPTRTQAQQEKGGAGTPAALYKEVAEYPRRRYEELRSQGKRADAATTESIAREQRTLAARYSSQLSARTDLAALDIFYLGMLYNTAAKKGEALAAMRRFLAEKPTAAGVPAQLARYVIATCAAQTKLLDESESSLSEYLRNEPQNPEMRFVMENELAVAQYKARAYDRAAAHAAAAFEAARSTALDPSLPEDQRDHRIFAAGVNLVESYSQMKKRPEAIAAIAAMRQVALSLPSAGLYKLVSEKYAGKEKEVEAAGNDGPSAGQGATNAPELMIAEWIDQQPTKLADLRGNVILVDFWYEWCEPCRAAFPKLRGWHKKYKDKGLVVLGITEFQGAINGREMDRPEELEYLRKFKKEYSVPYGFGIGANKTNLRRYGVAAYPTVVLIDRRGAVRYFGVGTGPQETEKLSAMIERLLKEPAEAPVVQKNN